MNKIFTQKGAEFTILGVANPPISSLGKPFDLIFPAEAVGTQSLTPVFVPINSCFTPISTVLSSGIFSDMSSH